MTLAACKQCEKEAKGLEADIPPVLEDDDSRPVGSDPAGRVCISGLETSLQIKLVESRTRSRNGGRWWPQHRAGAKT